MTWMIVGLGNPGGQYSQTRHNIGFMAIDHALKTFGNPPMKNQFKAEIFLTKWNDHQIILVKPQTYMNLSGESVQPLMGFYKVSLEHLIVVHDEIDQPFAHMKIQKNRGHGGHNGIKSITGLMGSMDYTRLRLGVGRPENPNVPVADYVLNKFTPEEFQAMPAFLDKATDALQALMTDGIQKASTKFNS